MKIDRRDFPIHSGDYKIDYIDTGLDKAIDNTMYLSNNILDIVDTTDQKFLKLRNEIKDVKRCILYKHKGNAYCFMYSFEVMDELTHFNYIGQLVRRGFDIHTMYGYNAFYHKEDCSRFHVLSNANGDTLKIVVQLIINIEVFLQYAKLETKILKKNEKDSIICRYQNKLPLHITIVDSTWYTNLIKSDAFKVRGHFRLQPHGNGLKNRKLIWINEYQKEGYVREAKKLSQQI